MCVSPFFQPPRVCAAEPMRGEGVSDCRSISVLLLLASGKTSCPESYLSLYIFEAKPELLKRVGTWQNYEAAKKLASPCPVSNDKIDLISAELIWTVAPANCLLAWYWNKALPRRKADSPSCSQSRWVSALVHWFLLVGVTSSYNFINNPFHPITLVLALHMTSAFLTDFAYRSRNMPLSSIMLATLKIAIIQ